MAIAFLTAQVGLAVAQGQSHIKLPLDSPIVRTIDAGAGATLVVSDQGEVIRFNPNVENGQPESLAALAQPIADLVPLRDLSATLILDRDGQLRLLRDGATDSEFLLPAPVQGKLFAAGKGRALLADADGNYTLIDVTSKTATPVQTFPDFKTNLKLYDDLSLAGFQSGESLQLVDVGAGESLTSLPIGEAIDFDVSKARSLVAVASRFGGVQIWDLVQQEPLDFILGMLDDVWYLKFLESGDLLTLTRPGVATIYSSQDWRPVHTFQVPPMSELRFANVSANNELMLTTDAESVHTIPLVQYGAAARLAPSGYVPVKLWYATNRLPGEQSSSLSSRLVQWICQADVIAVLTIIGVLTATLTFFTMQKGWRLLSSVAVAAASILVLAAGLFALVDRNAKSASADPEDYFGNVLDESGEVAWGRCEVTVPVDRLPGEINEPRSFLGFQEAANPEKHFIITSVEPTSSESIIDEVKAQGEPEEILVFVHGYNVPFAAAAKRTAQLKVDLNIQGEAFFFSWPSHGDLSRYLADEDNAELSKDPFQEMLKTISEPFPNVRIHLIGHSMGTRIIHESIRQLHADRSPVLTSLDSLVLAAPDIDRRQFRSELAETVRELNLPITLYASANDKALMVSGQLHNNSRLGDVFPEPVVMAGVETIDCSMIDTDWLGHGYYGDSRDLLQDLIQVIRDDRPAEQRFGLTAQQIDNEQRYWYLRP
ncbi:alpha/beta fold hydrolase [Blastopirellula sp. J2-11]|uniref:alpha/beta hydrolase n=1 Tax=Blastopirellula sp. J2-11 TaxID=2943192 RepID=UPI0021C79642|nr:alpha/beta hydrolase [Blastopirellula sp. J2-11]UUO08350.1 alpha/beta fold hydrolase [Blastopirellula sp. J2-11]